MFLTLFYFIKRIAVVHRGKVIITIIEYENINISKTKKDIPKTKVSFFSILVKPFKYAVISEIIFHFIGTFNNLPAEMEKRSGPKQDP